MASAALNSNLKIKPTLKIIEMLLDIKNNDELLPQNISNLLRILIKRKFKSICLKEQPLNINFDENEFLILHKLKQKNVNAEKGIIEILNSNSIITENQKIESNIPSHQFDKYLKIIEQHHLYLELNDIKWLHNFFQKKRDTLTNTKYVHEFLFECFLIIPEKKQKERDPVLEARCQKLKAEQENFEYNKITKNVDAFRRRIPEDTISYQVKLINKQLIAILQFVFSVAAGFAFGFIGVELIIGNLDFGFRLLLGIICALTIALAEIYFLAKKLNEINEIPDVSPIKKKKID